LEVARIARQEAVFNVRGAQGYYDPRFGLTGYRLKRVSPVSSLIGGAANGKLTFKEWNADPQVSGVSPWLGGSYRLDFNSSRQLTDSQFVTLNPQFPTTANLSLTQPLWRGLRFDENRHRLQVARKNLRLTAEQFRQRVIEIVTQAIEAYWDLDFARRNLDVQIEAVRLAERQDQSNRRQVQQGLLAPVDVIAAQTQVATFQQNVFTAQETLTRAENNLKALMLPDRNDLLWGTALIPETQIDQNIATPTLEEATRRALRDRPELAQSGVAIEINGLDARLSRELAKPQIDAFALLSSAGLAGRALPPGPNPFTGGFLPLIAQLNQLSALNGLAPITSLPGFGGNQIPPIFPGGYGQSLGNLQSGYFPTVQLGVQMSLPLRNRTAHAQSAISAAEGRRLLALRNQAEILIEADVRNSLQSVESARARLDAAALARTSAEDQYSSEQRQFQAGTSTVFLVLQRQTDLISARTREVRAKADFGKAVADLDRATARTMEAQNIKLER
ncbi:MAG: TolC family protein, partial [Acidobacteriota bacterium]|nr:TolC family protein [Acidobacteriota bacterium]